MNKVTKIKTIIISVVGVSFLLSVLFYFLTPLLGSVAFSSFGALGSGIIKIFKFDFSFGWSFIVFGFAVIALILNIWWVVVLLLKKRPKDLFWVIPVVVLNLLATFFMSAYFLADVTLNGVDTHLYIGILALENNIVSSLLTSLSLFFLVIALLGAGLFMFYDLTASTFELKPQVKVVKVVETRVVSKEEYVDSNEDYYDRMIREMGMFHENEN